MAPRGRGACRLPAPARDTAATGHTLYAPHALGQTPLPSCAWSREVLSGPHRSDRVPGGKDVGDASAADAPAARAGLWPSYASPGSPDGRPHGGLVSGDGGGRLAEAGRAIARPTVRTAPS